MIEKYRLKYYNPIKLCIIILYYNLIYIIKIKVYLFKCNRNSFIKS